MGHQQTHQAWIVTVDMGYGHQRAAFPLRHLSPTREVIIANRYHGIPHRDFSYWKRMRSSYEFISRLQTLPVIGRAIFKIMDNFQAISRFDARTTSARPTLQLKQFYHAIKRGLGHDLINRLNEKNIPLITTFFAVAYMAEEHDFKGEIYLVVCDTDVSRSWAPLHPEKSRINYFAPTERVAARLKTYGVKDANIFLSGFPLPDENIGGMAETVLKPDLAARIHNLDPKHTYRSTYQEVINKILKKYDNEKPTHPFTITIAIGGAGAQKNLAGELTTSLYKNLLSEKIHLNLIAGTRPEVDWYFRTVLKKVGLHSKLGKNITIIYKPTKDDYFKQFNAALRTTDVLWTKPSELVFYTALGLPIIIAPALGSQEEYNQGWLEINGAGVVECDPSLAHEWLFEWLASGTLANAAMNAYTHGERHAVETITDIVFGKKHASKK